MKYLLIIPIVLLICIYVLYRIGKKVRKQEAELLAQWKNEARKMKNARKMVSYKRKSTPKVPAIKK